MAHRWEITCACGWKSGLVRTHKSARLWAAYHRNTVHPVTLSPIGPAPTIKSTITITKVEEAARS